MPSTSKTARNDARHLVLDLWIFLAKLLETMLLTRFKLVQEAVQKCNMLLKLSGVAWGLNFTALPAPVPCRTCECSKAPANQGTSIQSRIGH